MSNTNNTAVCVPPIEIMPVYLSQPGAVRAPALFSAPTSAPTSSTKVIMNTKPTADSHRQPHVWTKAITNSVNPLDSRRQLPVSVQQSGGAQKPAAKPRWTHSTAERAVHVIDTESEYEVTNQIPEACVQSGAYDQLPLAHMSAMDPVVTLSVRFVLAQSGQRLYRLSEAEQKELVRKLHVQKRRIQQAIDNIEGLPLEERPLSVRSDGAFVRGDELILSNAIGKWSASDPTRGTYHYTI